MLAIAITVAITAIAYVMLVDLSSYEDGNCFFVELELMVWAVVSSLVGACACATYLAATRAPGAAYLLLIAAVALLGGVTYWLGAAANACTRPASAFVIVAMGLVAGSLGLVPGMLVGRVLRRRR